MRNFQLPCPACGSHALREVIRCPDHLRGNDSFTIVQCWSCDFLFTGDAPDKDGIVKYYQSDDYRPLTGQRPLAVRIIRRLRWHHMARTIKQLCKINNGTILDIGCGTGDFLFVMSKYGWNVIGVEPSERGRNNAKDMFGLTIQSLQHLVTISTQSVDAVTLFHVLEHVHDIRWMLDSIKRVLTPEGKCFIIVPNPESRGARQYGLHWHGYELPRHLYHFTPHTLQKLVNQHGMVIEQVQPMYIDTIYSCCASEKYQNGSLFRGYLRSLSNMILSKLNTRNACAILYTIGHSDKRYSSH